MKDLTSLPGGVRFALVRLVLKNTILMFGFFALWFRYGLPIKFVVVRLRPNKNKKASGGGGGCGGVVGGGGGDGWLWWW